MMMITGIKVFLFFVFKKEKEMLTNDLTFCIRNCGFSAF